MRAKTSTIGQKWLLFPELLEEVGEKLSGPGNRIFREQMTGKLTLMEKLQPGPTNRSKISKYKLSHPRSHLLVAASTSLPRFIRIRTPSQLLGCVKLWCTFLKSRCLLVHSANVCGMTYQNDCTSSFLPQFAPHQNVVHHSHVLQSSLAMRDDQKSVRMNTAYSAGFKVHRLRRSGPHLQCMERSRCYQDNFSCDPAHTFYFYPIAWC
jgi:hypothetical protein